MSDPHRTRPPTHSEPTPSIATQVAVGVARSGEFFLRDQLVTGTVFFSLITLLSVLTAPSAPYVVALLAVGVPGLVLPWVTRSWSPARTWLVLGALLALDVLVLVVTFAAD